MNRAGIERKQTEDPDERGDIPFNCMKRNRELCEVRKLEVGKAILNETSFYKLRKINFTFTKMSSRKGSRSDLTQSCLKKKENKR